MASRTKQTRTMRQITSQTSPHAARALKSLRWVSVAGLLVVDWANGNDEDEVKEKKVWTFSEVASLIQEYAPWFMLTFAAIILVCYCWIIRRSASSRVVAENEQAEKTIEEKGELKIEDVFHKGEDAMSWTNVQQRESFRKIRLFPEPSSDRSITDRATESPSDPSPASTGSRARGQRKPPKVPVGIYSSSASDTEQQRLPVRQEDRQSSGLQDGYGPRGADMAVRKI